jgi:hypothetical protein
MDNETTPKTKEGDKNPDKSGKHTATQEQASEATQEKPSEPESDERFDFGGLPNRNLKKNLGCG